MYGYHRDLGHGTLTTIRFMAISFMTLPTILAIPRLACPQRCLYQHRREWRKLGWPRDEQLRDLQQYLRGRPRRASSFCTIGFAGTGTNNQAFNNLWYAVTARTGCIGSGAVCVDNTFAQLLEPVRESRDGLPWHGIQRSSRLANRCRNHVVGPL